MDEGKVETTALVLKKRKFEDPVENLASPMETKKEDTSLVISNESVGSVTIDQFENIKRQFEGLIVDFCVKRKLDDKTQQLLAKRWSTYCIGICRSEFERLYDNKFATEEQAKEFLEKYTRLFGETLRDTTDHPIALLIQQEFPSEIYGFKTMLRTCQFVFPPDTITLFEENLFTQLNSVPDRLTDDDQNLVFELMKSELFLKHRPEGAYRRGEIVELIGKQRAPPIASLMIFSRHVQGRAHKEREKLGEQTGKRFEDPNLSVTFITIHLNSQEPSSLRKC
jgi:hypothetical protein